MKTLTRLWGQGAEQDHRWSEYEVNAIARWAGVQAARCYIVWVLFKEWLKLISD